MNKEAMKLALNKAFQLGERYWSWADSEYSSHWKKADVAKAEFDQLVQDTINAALAEQPAQEPVAVVSGYYGGQCVILPIDPARIFNSNTALYTSPPPCPTCEALARTVMLDQTSHDAQRKPLTPLEIENLRDEHLYSVQGVIQGHEAFARAIEAAHGITGEKK